MAECIVSFGFAILPQQGPFRVSSWLCSARLGCASHCRFPISIRFCVSSVPCMSPCGFVFHQCCLTPDRVVTSLIADQVGTHVARPVANSAVLRRHTTHQVCTFQHHTAAMISLCGFDLREKKNFNHRLSITVVIVQILTQDENSLSPRRGQLGSHSRGPNGQSSPRAGP
jgi:hypothetical protein